MNMGGAFGRNQSTTTPGSTGLFGSASTPGPSGSVFGQNNPSQSGYVGFGSSLTTPPATSTGMFGAVQTSQQSGTSAVPYQQTSKQDDNTTITIQAISAMPVYENKSFEELRFEGISMKDVEAQRIIRAEKNRERAKRIKEYRLKSGEYNTTQVGYPYPGWKMNVSPSGYKHYVRKMKSDLHLMSGVNNPGPR